MTHDHRKPIPREDLFYPYIFRECNLKRFDVIYTKNNPIIVASFKDIEEAKWTAKQLNSSYLDEQAASQFNWR
jgi:hypothetical protein